jgi:hypothetical protein
MRGGDFATSSGGRNLDMRDRSSRSFAMARASDPGRVDRSNTRVDRNDMRRRFANRDRDRDHDRHRHRCFHDRCFPFVGFGYGGYGGYGDYYDDSYTYADNDAVAYCMSRFRTYDPASGTYIGNDGLRHACP